MPFGEDVRIDDTVRLNGSIKVGKHVSIDYGVYCTVALEVGDYTHIGPHCSIVGGGSASLSMGHFSFLAAGCRVVCASDEHLGEGIGIPWMAKARRDNVINKPIRIGMTAGVCTGSILLPGAVVPEGVIIGAGCIVRKDNLEPWTVYMPGIAGEPMPIKERRRDKVQSIVKEMGYEFPS